MTFQITALDPAPYAPLFALSDDELRARGARRVVADASPGFPCRASLADAEPGETLILVNHQHLDGVTPYAAAHAVFFREGAAMAEPAPGEVPLVLRRRLLSVRAFNADKMMIDAEVLDGQDLAAHLDALFARPEIAFVHVHNARPGCFAAAAGRA
ncbi:hypothetical protein IP88_11805 [alpha proteobacterium AAP81b]|nr:hypothetical protein IP88_11805 [alpha proteobacterium AAP81b]